MRGVRNGGGVGHKGEVGIVVHVERVLMSMVYRRGLWKVVGAFPGDVVCFTCWSSSRI